jgi:hypothetical protein
MKACPNHQETLWLDVYGELKPDERSAWQQHLESCSACREERQRLLGLIERLKEEMTPPELSPEKANALSWSIKRALRNQKAGSRSRLRTWGMPSRLIPALAAACFMIIVLGWFGIDKFQGPFKTRNLSGLNSQEQMIVKDLEIIKNLEFLEEMDTVQKLVRVVDHREIRDGDFRTINPKSSEKNHYGET